MKNYNLLQVLPALESGGVEQGTIDLANFLGNKKLGSFVVSNGGKMTKLLNSRKTTHVSLPVHTKNFLLMPFIARKLNKIILDKNIDIVHVRSRAPAWLLQFISNKNFKRVSTFHNVYNSSNYIKKNYNQSLTKVDHIIAISKFVKSEIIDTYKINSKKITVINRGIDTNFFNPKKNNKDEFIKFLNKYKIEDDKKIILYPGRLTEWKGQIKFLDIVESFKNEKIIFYFVGDTKNQSYTSKFLNEIKRKNIEKNCKIFGNFSKYDMKNIYKCADLVISAPLRPEGFGRIVGESLAMEKITLCYNFGGVKNQLEGLDKIYKVEPGNTNEMKNKIKEVFNFTKKLKQNFGSSSRSHIINNFSLEKMLIKYHNYYKKIVL